MIAMALRRLDCALNPKPARVPVPRSIWVLVAAAFVIAIGYGLIAPVLPAYAESFDVGVTAATIIVSAFAFFRLLFAPASGKLVSKLGERPVYLIGLFIVAVSTGACALADSYWQLLVFRSLGGIGSTMFTVSAMGLLVRLADPRARGRISGLYASAFLIGNMFGPILGGVLSDFLGMRVPFLIYAAALLVAMAVVWTMLRDAHPVAVGRDGAEHPPMRLREAWRDSAYRAALGSSFANGWASFGVRVSVVPLFVVALGGSTLLVGIAMAVFAVGNTLALFPAGRLADQRGRKPLVIAGLAVAGGGTIWLGFVADNVTLLLACLIAGAGTGLLNAPQQAAVADIIGSHRRGGPVLATFQMVSDVGAIIGPILAGLLVEHLSYRAAFAFTGIILLLALLPWLRAQETLPKAGVEDERIG